jgi:hypothetical protein
MWFGARQQGGCLMKSQTRAWMIFALLFFLWGTLPISPFAYFAGMIREWSGFLISQPFFPGSWQAILIYVLTSLILITFLLLGRSRNRVYIAGICALAEMVYHLIICIRTNRIYPVSLAIAGGLALALFFLLIKAKSPSIWLSDAYILSLPVFLIYDGVLHPLGQLLDIPPDKFAPFVPIPETALITNLDHALGLPMAVWSILPLLLAVLPLVFFSSGRQKG